MDQSVTIARRALIGTYHTLMFMLTEERGLALPEFTYTPEELEQMDDHALTRVVKELRSLSRTPK